MLILLGMIVLAVLVLLLLFGGTTAGQRVFGIISLLVFFGGIYILVGFPPPRQCEQIQSIEALYWDKSPFKTDINYLGINNDSTGNTSNYPCKVVDDYGTVHMIELPKANVAFLGTKADGATIIRFRPTSGGYLRSLSWRDAYVVVLPDHVLLSGENSLALEKVPVYHVREKGLDPRLKRWLGCDDDKKILGQPEAPEVVK